MTRCVRGDLARFIRSYAGNEGRRVVVGDPGPADEALGPTWFVKPLQPIWLVSYIATTTRGDMLFSSRSLVMPGDPVHLLVPDAWLEPIRDGLPDEATDTAESLSDGVHVVGIAQA